MCLLGLDSSQAIYLGEGYSFDHSNQCIVLLNLCCVISPVRFQVFHTEQKTDLVRCEELN